MSNAEADAYVELLRETVEPGPLRDWAEAYARRAMPRVADDVARVLARNPTTVLDVGAAPFLFEFLARRVHGSTIDLSAIDIEPGRFERLIGTLDIKVIRGNIETDQIDLPAPVDIVIWTEMIEHCRINLIETTRRVGRMARPGGYVYLTTPNGRSLTRLVRFIGGGRTGRSLVGEWTKLEKLGHMGHVREYSRTELDELFAYCGLKVAGFRTREALRSGGGFGHRMLRRVERHVPGWRDNLVYFLKSVPTA